MKKIFYLLLMTSMAALLLPACEKDRYGDPPQASVPVITSAAVEPATFTYGDSVTLTAVLSDPETPISELTVSLVLNGRSIPLTTLDLRTGETSVNVSEKILVPLVNEMPDNAPLTLALRLTNVRNGAASHDITGLTGKRPYFSQLYLVVENGGVYPLAPAASDKDKYATDAMLTRSFTYRIAQKITADNQIDYSGFVWGDNGGKIQLIGEDGGGIFAFSSGADYTSSLTFDNYRFTTTVTGSVYETPNLMIETFDGQETIGGEGFYKKAVTYAKNEEIAVYNELAATDVVFNVDFFERINANKVKFLGESGTYTLYYNPERKNVIVGVDNPAYPDFLLITGGGLGYPSKMSNSREHTWWGFGNIRDYILMNKIGEGIYQGTFFIHAKDDSWVGFKVYEGEWDGEMEGSDFTFTGLDLLEGDGDIHPKEALNPDMPYRITVNLDDKTMNIAEFPLQ
jgi:hypothetical protein